MIDRPLRRDGHIPGRHGRGDRLVPTGEGIAFSCRGGGRSDGCTVVLRDGCDGTAAGGVKGDGVLIDCPLRRDGQVFGGHRCRERRIPARKGIAGLGGGFGRGDGGAVVLRDGRNFTAAGGVEGDGILIDLPLRPVFLIAHFCTADCRHRIAGQTLVIIPALERVAGIGHIVGCRECCAHTVDVFGDIAVVDRAAVGVQCDGIGRVCPLHCQCCHISRNTVTGNVEFTVASAPHKEIACISVRAVQTIGRRRGKLAAGFHDDLNILGAITQRAAAKVKGNDLQSVRTQCVRVQDFKHGAENDIRVGARSIVDAPEAGRNEPANRTERRVVSCCVLPPRIYAIPVFDVAAVLVQHCVPFVALGHAALGIARTCSVTSHRRCAQGIVHAAAGIIFAENQTFRI